MASGEKPNCEVDSIFLVVSRSDVETGNTEEILRSLNKINSSRESVLRFLGAVNVGVHGYDTDDRELFEIQEVRRYFKILTEQFPYFFFFSNLRLSTLKVIAFCVCGAHSVSSGTVQIDNVKLATFMQQQFAGLNALFHEYDLDESHPDLNREISEQVMLYLGM